MFNLSDDEGPVPWGWGADSRDHVAWEAGGGAAHFQAARKSHEFELIDYDGSKEDDCGSDTKEDAIKHE